MSVLHTIFVLAVPNLERSAAFYRDVLGFEVREIDESYEKAVAAGAELVKALATEPWGMREFGIRTVDGHRIMFGQEVT